MKYSGGWSLSEAYNLPVGLRKWFVERLIKQLEAEKEAIDQASSSSGNQKNQTYTLNEANSPPAPRNYSKTY